MRPSALQKRTGPNRFKVEVFKKTKDDWHPSYVVPLSYKQMLLVRVFMAELRDADNNAIGYRVGAAGGDDDMMEKDFRVGEQYPDIVPIWNTARLTF